MERESRRSKEEEEELDRKIAQIREKNQKIEERQKEIAAEIQATLPDGPQRKSSKPSPPSTGTTKTGKGEWDREWDHGKTPAETWRENVPSMETRKKPSGRGGGAHQWSSGQRARRGGRKTRGSRSSEEGTPQVPKGGRLEGRVTVNPDLNRATARRGRGRGGSRQQHCDRNATKNDGELKNNVKNADENAAQPKHQKNTRRSAKTSTNHKDEQAAQNHQVRNKPKRRYTEKYEIKQLLRALVNRVERTERKERQRTQRQLKEQNSLDKQEQKKSENAREELKERKPQMASPPNATGAASVNNVDKTPPTVATAERAPVVTTTPKAVPEVRASPAKELASNAPASVVASKEMADVHVSTPPKTASEARKSPDKLSQATPAADANQNVIKLVEEKVLQIQLS